MPWNRNDEKDVPLAEVRWETREDLEMPEMPEVKNLLEELVNVTLEWDNTYLVAVERTIQGSVEVYKTGVYKPGFIFLEQDGRFLIPISLINPAPETDPERL
ncbi:hypothetical protein B0H16DRAFT_1471843 [Mycena metata]|uniref:Uncharacterized protein n=1 Tax=Mycena metata TaxID=1033252 RepID=A0AAD7HPP0_9AGAR|nr:hypothetical protein B0H16DRAFT_1471843 [Mycena metata]